MPSSQLAKEIALPTSGFTLDWVPPISPTGTKQVSKFLMVGGLTASSEVFPYVVSYNPKQRELQFVHTLGPFPQEPDQYSEIPGAPTQKFSPSRRHLHTSCLLHRRLFVFGGYALPADTSSKDQDNLMCDPQKIYSLDVDTQQWQRVEVISSPRYYEPSRTESVGTIITEPGLSHTLDDGLSSESDEEPREVSDINGAASHAQTGPLARIGHTCVPYPSNPKSVMVLFGGYTSSGLYSNELCTFQVAPGQERGSWASLATPLKVPVGRCGHSANVYGNSMIVFGGFDGRRCLNDLWRYDFSAKGWRPLADGPSPRFGHTSVLSDDQLFILGGRDSEGRDLNDLWSFSLVNFRWQVLSSQALVTPGGVFGAKAIALEGKAFIFGGEERKQPSFTIRVLDLLHTDRPSHDTIVHSLLIDTQFKVPPKSRARSRQVSQASSQTQTTSLPEVVPPPKAKSRAKKRLDDLKTTSPHDTRLTFNFDNDGDFVPISGVFASPDGPIVSPKTQGPTNTARKKDKSQPPKVPKPPTESPGEVKGSRKKEVSPPEKLESSKAPPASKKSTDEAKRSKPKRASPPPAKTEMLPPNNQKDLPPPPTKTEKDTLPPSNPKKAPPPPTKTEMPPPSSPNITPPPTKAEKDGLPNNQSKTPPPPAKDELPLSSPKKEEPLPIKSQDVPPPAPKSRARRAVKKDIANGMPDQESSRPKENLRIDPPPSDFVEATHQSMSQEISKLEAQVDCISDDDMIHSFSGFESPQMIPYAPLAKSIGGDLNKICEMAEQLPNLILNDLTCAYEGYEKSLGDIAYLKARLAIVATHQPGKLESLHDAHIKRLEEQLLEATSEIWRLKQDRTTYRQLVASANSKLSNLESDFQKYTQSQVQAQALKCEMEMQAEITKLSTENRQLADNVEHLQAKVHAHSLESFTLKAQLKVSESRQNALEKALEHANSSEQVALERAGIAEKLVEQITRQDMEGEEQTTQDQHFKALWQAARRQINLARKLSNPLAVASEEVMAELDQTHMAFQNATNTIHELVDQVETLSTQLETHSANHAPKHEAGIYTSYVKLVEQQQDIHEKISQLHTQALQQKSNSHTLEQSITVSDARWRQLLKVNQEVTRRNKAVLSTISNLTNGQFTSAGMSSLEVPIAASTLSSKLSEDDVLSKLQISLMMDEPSIGSLGSAADIKKRLASLRTANLKMSQDFLSSPNQPLTNGHDHTSPNNISTNPSPLPPSPTAAFPSLQALAELDNRLDKHQHQYSSWLGQKLA